MINTCIIIPCFNEFSRFPILEFEQFIEKNDVFFLFVNDGSKDKTEIILQELSQKFPKKVNFIRNEHNQGKAETVRNGVLHSLKNESFTYIGFFDADLSTPLVEINNFINVFNSNKDVKLILGSRIKRLGSKVERKFSRFIFGRIFATIISKNVLKIPIYDSQCGAKMFTRNIALDMFQQPFYTKWIFDVEILLRLKKKFGREFLLQKVVEFPLNSWIEKGDSKIKFTDFLKVPKDIFKLKVKY